MESLMYIPYLTTDFLSPYDGGNAWIRGGLAFILGSCIGSFLNVVACSRNHGGVDDRIA
jgi:hypothetical protein